ncbi:MAG TPA: YgjP-like metallopeptidase domain-containing protein [Candidatus Paceibacterota bacterium]|nr:YgjP-like metallopeptidase domain-containing protein [Candidatus Paceibacterota bacterium]
MSWPINPLVHDLRHWFEPNHRERFIQLLDAHLPDWRNRKRGKVGK